MDEFRTRKSPRMRNFHYENAASYFVTICTHQMRCLFGSPDELNAYGQTACLEIMALEHHYSGIQIAHFVVMPNHVHILISLYGTQRVSLSTIVGTYKAGVSRKIHELDPDLRVWQRSFHDHIIRTKREWELIWQYISENPIRWKMDKFFQEP